LVDVDKVDIAECNITNVALTGICLDPRSVGAMDCGNVFEEHVVDVVWRAGRVTKGADAHGATFIAGHVPDVDVATVAFDGNAVLSHRQVDLRMYQGPAPTSPHVTTQFLMTIFFEFQLSKPSVLTVLHCELDVAFMSKFVMVIFSECATECMPSSHIRMVTMLETFSPE
jgi:hypothetical protein